MRKRISSELKGKVAIAALQGHRTVNEIASEYEVLPAQVSAWKKLYLESASSVFSSPKKALHSKEDDHLISTLYQKIGVLEVECDFLKKKVAEAGRPLSEMRLLVETEHKELTIIQQCILLSISRSGFYYTGKNRLDGARKTLIDAIDELYTDQPYLGTRKMMHELRKQNIYAGRKAIRSCYQLLNIAAIYPKVTLTTPNKEHKKYPYLLRDLQIDRVNQVWSTDITYIRMDKGFMYLCAVIDWHSRRILSWGLSNTHDAEFTTQVLTKAIHDFGTPEIFNTDQGSEFTASQFTDVLKKNGIRISMDGKGRALDNIFVERLWRTIKYEYVFIAHPSTGTELFEGLSSYIERYNMKRLHQSLGYKTPDQIYRQAS